MTGHSFLTTAQPLVDANAYRPMIMSIANPNILRPSDKCGQSHKSQQTHRVRDMTTKKAARGCPCILPVKLTLTLQAETCSYVLMRAALCDEAE